MRATDLALRAIAAGAAAVAVWNVHSNCEVCASGRLRPCERCSVQPAQVPEAVQEVAGFFGKLAVLALALRFEAS